MVVIIRFRCLNNMQWRNSADAGLLISKAFSENELATAGIHGQLIAGEQEINEGMIKR